jgi:hypothetical protein
MRLLPLAVLLIASASHCAEAVVTSADATFAMLCTDDKATGFQWQSGAWVWVTFPAEKEVVQRTLPLLDAVCQYEMAGKTAEYQDMLDTGSGFALGCYNIRNANATFNRLDTKVCFENWSGGALQRVDCSDSYSSLTFAPDGNFQRSRISGDLADSAGATDIRAPLIIAIGRCVATAQ